LCLRQLAGDGPCPGRRQELAPLETPLGSPTTRVAANHRTPSLYLTADDPGLENDQGRRRDVKSKDGSLYRTAIRRWRTASEHASAVKDDHLR
jgi:hypothetical protein